MQQSGSLRAEINQFITLWSRNNNYGRLCWPKTVTTISPIPQALSQHGPASPPSGGRIWFPPLNWACVCDCEIVSTDRVQQNGRCVTSDSRSWKAMQLPPCALEHLCWEPWAATEESDSPEATMLPGSQATGRGHVWCAQSLRHSSPCTRSKSWQAFWWIHPPGVRLPPAFESSWMRPHTSRSRDKPSLLQLVQILNPQTPRTKWDVSLKMLSLRILSYTQQ